jgi:hypothetical protein
MLLKGVPLRCVARVRHSFQGVRYTVASPSKSKVKAATA